MLIRIVLPLLLLPALAHAASLTWADRQIGWTHYLLSSGMQTGIMIGGVSPSGPYTLYQNGSVVATGSSLSALETQGAALYTGP